MNKIVNPRMGMTVVEIMLVIMLLVILCGIVISIFFHIKWKESPEKTQQKKEILALENALHFYKLDNGFYPSNTQGLAALTTKPKTQPIPAHWIKYLKTVPQDPWGHSYHYSNPGRFKEIEVYSCGPSEKQAYLTKIKNWITSNPQINCQ